MKFRSHRGGLQESLDTVVELAPTDKALRDHLGHPGPIKVEYYIYDTRIDWDTWIVTAPEGVLGFTNGPVGSHEAI